MEHEEGKNVLTVEPTEKNIDYWIDHRFTPVTLKEKIKEANVLFVPAEGFRDYKGPVYPIGTRELFQYIEENAPDELKIEATIDESDYKELALHSALLIIGTFVVTAIVAPTFVNLTSEYLKKRWGDKFLSKPDASVKFELIMQEKDRAAKLLYEGPASTFETEVLKKLPDLVSGIEEDNENIERSNLIS